MSIEASRVETHVDAPPEVVWQALTSTENMGQFFMGATVHTTWQIGSPITFEGEWKGKKYQDKGTIQKFAVDRTLSFTHLSDMSGAEDKPENYHVVTFELEPAGDQTRVVLTQDNMNEAEPLSDETRKEFSKNWASVLQGLKEAAERARAL